MADIAGMFAPFGTKWYNLAAVLRCLVRSGAILQRCYSARYGVVQSCSDAALLGTEWYNLAALLLRSVPSGAILQCCCSARYEVVQSCSVAALLGTEWCNLAALLLCSVRRGAILQRCCSAWYAAVFYLQYHWNMIYSIIRVSSYHFPMSCFV